jgi:peptidoglycan hydrolase-like protein with peptidoglycan-binding domain
MRFREFKIISEATKGRQADIPSFDAPGYFTVGDSHSNGVGGYGKGKTWKAMGMDGASAFDPMHISAIERIPSGSVVAISLGANDLKSKPIQQIVSQVNKVIATAKSKSLQVVYLLPTTTAPNKTNDPKRDELRSALKSAVSVPIVDLGQASPSDSMGLHLDAGKYNSIGSQIASNYTPKATGLKTDSETTNKTDQQEKPQDRIKSSMELEQGPPFPPEDKDEVTKMQTALQELGYNVGRFGTDGKYGPFTAAAVAGFKKDYSLEGSGSKFGKAEFDTIAKIKSGQLARVENPTKVNIGSANDGAGLSGTKETNAAFKEPYFMEKLKKVASNLGVAEKDLIGIMKHESNLNPRAVNPYSKATGLIQFMPDTARSLGTTIGEIYKMSATEQLDLVEKYYKVNGVKAGDDIGDLYMLTFMPAARSKPDSFVLGNKDGGRVFGLSAAAVYNQNNAFDSNKDGIFTVGDVKDRIRRYA